MIAAGGHSRWLLRTLRPFRKSIVAVVGLLSLAQASYALDPMFIRWIIDHGIHETLGTKAFVIAGVFLLLVICRLGLFAMGSLLKESATQAYSARLRMRLFRKSLRLPMAELARAMPGTLSYRIEQDVDTVSELSFEIVPGILRILIYFGISLAFMAFISWKVTLCLVPLLVLFVYLRRRMTGPISKLALQARDSASARNARVAEAITYAITIRLLGAESRFARVLVTRIREGAQAQLRLRWIDVLNFVLTTGLIGLATVSLMGFGYAGLIHNQLSVGDFVALYTYLTRLFDPISGAMEWHNQYVKSISSVGKLAAFAAEPDGVIARGKGGLGEGRISRLCLEGVSFGHADGEQFIKDLDFEARVGEWVAITGSSGSGKTTIAGLMAGIHAPLTGAVRINDIDVRQIPRPRMRALVGLLPQQSHFFDGSILQNMRLVRPNVSEAELDDLAQIVRMGEVVARHPQGWEQPMGNDGSVFSGGERQRLALMRALLTDKPILVFDEATSALDHALEGEILGNLKAATLTRMVVFITHRAAPLVYSDRVLQLKEGRFTTETHMMQVSKIDETIICA